MWICSIIFGNRRSGDEETPSVPLFRGKKCKASLGLPEGRRWRDPLSSFRTSPVPFTLEGVPPLPLSPPLTYCRPLSRLDKAKASFALCSLLHRLSQGREKLRISRIPHSQSSGIAREACALKGERCVFYEMDINPHVDSVERNGVGIFHIFLHTCCP